MSVLQQASGAPAGVCGPAFDLNAGEVTVWRVFLDAGPREIHEVMGVLPALELEEALQLVDPIRRHRFLVARAARRVLLARYLDTRPDSLRFDVGAFGKPTVRCHARRPPLRFNQSRSAHLTLIALASEHEIGVDVEQIDPGRADHDVARRCFPSHELQDLLRLPAHMWPAGFFERWTQLEARAKATGRGLAETLQPGSRQHRAVDTEPDAQRATGRWRLHTYRPANGFVASVAVNAAAVTLRQFDWPRTWTS
jgi:4'-phosphopantetheinyl transferase